MNIEKRIEDLGLQIPEAPNPAASYVTYKKSGNLLFISGQGPAINGKLDHVGKVGDELSAKEAYQAAKFCGLNLIAQVKKCLGDLDLVKNIVHVKGYVASSTDFYEQPYVMNGASDLIAEVFGEKGKHTRCALGTSVLPGNIPVEVEMVVEV